MGRKQTPVHNWSQRPPVTMETRPQVCAWPPLLFRQARAAGFPNPRQGGAGLGAGIRERGRVAARPPGARPCSVLSPWRRCGARDRHVGSARRGRGWGRCQVDRPCKNFWCNIEKRPFSVSKNGGAKGCRGWELNSQLIPWQ